MAGEWVAAPLGDLVEDILDRRGVTPLKLGSDFVSAGHRVISAKLVKSGRIDLAADEPRFVNDTTYQKWMRTPLLADDVLLTSEAPLGGVAYVGAASDWVLGQRLFAIRTDKRRLHGRFLFYALQCEPMRHGLQSRATGTTAQGIRQSELRRVMVPLPPLAEQQRMADILGTLDDKIELNRRMSDTLEVIARALFKSWFVDFAPVRAKSEGRDPGVPPHLADLFPDSFEDSELGEIPKGWRVCGLDEIATYLNGLALQKYPPDDSGYLPVIKIAQLRAGHTDGADQASSDIPPAYVVEDGDILFSWSGSLEVEIWCGGRGALNQHLFKVTSDQVPKWFSFLWTRHHLADFRGIAAGKATTMGHIQRGHLSAASTLVPPQPLLEAMSAHFAPLLADVIVGQLQSRTLAALRDALLPKLISGELRMADAKRVLEAAS
jgi:type I restriction enzyme S subunit